MTNPRKRPTKYANHPIVKYVRSLEQEFYLGREVAEMVDCSLKFLNYLRQHSTTPMGPTHQAQYGATVLYLYTPERVAQIGDYMKQFTDTELGRKRRGPITLWTKSETYTRRRAFARARTYRVRAIAYREQGLKAQAAELDRRATALTAKMEKARAARYRKVHGRRKPNG